jgi:hypothetical protein
MNIGTTINVLELLTLRECIEILVDRRTGRDRLRSLPPTGADFLGTTHIRPRAWIDEAKSQLHRALIAGEIGLYASRKIRDGANAVSDAFVRIPSEKLASSRAFCIALPGDVLWVRVKDSLASFHGSEIRISRSELEAWLRRRRKLLDRTKFRRRSPRPAGRPDSQLGLAINAIRELNLLGPPPTNKSLRQLAREVVAEIESRYGESISLRTAQRAVERESRRRSART